MKTKPISGVFDYGTWTEIRHQLTMALLRYGVSANGTQQLLAGENVTGLEDRRKITRIIQTKTIDHDETTLIRGNRTETVQNDEKIMLEKAGISALGAQQILFSQPVTNTRDRGQLALAVASIFNYSEVFPDVC